MAHWLGCLCGTNVKEHEHSKTSGPESKVSAHANGGAVELNIASQPLQQHSTSSNTPEAAVQSSVPSGLKPLSTHSPVVDDQATIAVHRPECESGLNRRPSPPQQQPLEPSFRDSQERPSELQRIATTLQQHTRSNLDKADLQDVLALIARDRDLMLQSLDHSMQVHTQAPCTHRLYLDALCDHACLTCLVPQQVHWHSTHRVRPPSLPDKPFMVSKQPPTEGGELQLLQHRSSPLPHLAPGQPKALPSLPPSPAQREAGYGDTTSSSSTVNTTPDSPSLPRGPAEVLVGSCSWPVCI